MPYHVAKAEKADIPQLVDIYFTTFKSPLVKWIKPDVPSIREWFKNSLENDIEKAYTRIYKVVESQAESVQTSDEIIAFGKWSAPHTEPPKDTPTNFPVEGDPAVFDQVISIAAEKRKTIMGEGEYWYLSVLATLPKHQRKGVGSLLMTEFCKQSDLGGHRSYLEASPAGRSTYERFAFETRDTFSTLLDGEPYVDCCMVREAQKSK